MQSVTPCLFPMGPVNRPLDHKDIGAKYSLSRGSLKLKLRRRDEGHWLGYIHCELGGAAPRL